MRPSAAAYANYIEEDVDSLFGDTRSSIQPYYEYTPPTFLDIASAENVDIIARVNQTIAANNFALTAELYNAYIEKIREKEGIRVNQCNRAPAGGLKRKV